MSMYWMCWLKHNNLLWYKRSRVRIMTWLLSCPWHYPLAKVAPYEASPVFVDIGDEMHEHAFSKCGVGSQVASEIGYPFHSTRYWSCRRCQWESRILSTSYSSHVESSIGGGGGECLPGIVDGWWGSRRDTWKTLWIRKCGGSSNQKVTGSNFL